MIFGRPMNRKNMLIVGILALIVLYSVHSTECGTDGFTINSLAIHILIEDDGDVFVTEISNIELKSPKSSIEYDLHTQTPFYVESVKFEGENQELNKISDFPWGETRLNIQINSNSTEGRLEVSYMTRTWSAYQYDEFEIFVSHIYLKNFGKVNREELNRSFTGIPIRVDLPKSFDLGFNRRIIANLRYSSSGDFSNLQTYFYSLDAYVENISENKCYSTVLPTEDAFSHEDDMFSLFDIEFIIITTRNFSHDEFIDYFSLDLDASDLKNIKAKMEIQEVKLTNAVTSISFLFPKNCSIDPSELFDMEIIKETEKRCEIRIFKKKREDAFGTQWGYVLKYNIEYDVFADQQASPYDIFYWKGPFVSNSRIFVFTLRLPEDAILLEVFPSHDLSQNTISWSKVLLYSDSHDDQEYFVKYIPEDKYSRILQYLLVIVLLGFFLGLAATRCLSFNEDFIGFLLGWAMYTCWAWYSVSLDPIFYDLLAYGQAVFIFLLAYLFGSQQRAYRLFFAFLVIGLWFYEDTFVFLGFAFNALLNLQDIGSKIFAAVILYIISRYHHSLKEGFLIFIRENASKSWLLVFAAISIYSVSLFTESSFREKMTITFLISILAVLWPNAIPLRDKWTMKCKTMDKLIKCNNICFFRCRIVEVEPRKPFSRRLEEREVVWVKLSNRNGFPTRGLAFNNVKEGQHLRVYGKGINRKEMSGKDITIIGEVEGIFEAREVLEEKKSIRADLLRMVKKTLNFRLKILDKGFFFDDEESTIFRIIHGRTNTLLASQIIQKIRTVAEDFDETEIMNVSEVFSERDARRFNLILLGTTLNNELIGRLAKKNIRPDDRSKNDWMIHSEGTYKFYTNPFQSGRT